MCCMGVTTGIVIDGKVVVEGEALPEGTTVAVFVPVDDETYELTASEAADLNRAINEVKAGNAIDGDEHIARLRNRP